MSDFLSRVHRHALLIGGPVVNGPFSTDGCGFCSVEPGEPHRHPRCMGIQEDAALCAGGLHTADGGCCAERDREIADANGGAR